MNTKAHGSIFIVCTLLTLCRTVLAAEPDVPPAMPRSEQLDRLMRTIHDDLKELSKKEKWLADYNDTCFHPKQGTIHFIPKEELETEGLRRPTPPQLNICYVPLEHKGFKWNSCLEDVPACRFPSLGLKLFVGLIAPDEKVQAAIRECIVRRCEAFQKELAK